ncbi:response regulator transcription factor [Lachnospiraceae bacterium MD1]|uniref:Stage 0 sporulation protein A homolog n=1 Tax=Variimorphobacter saccharofermentans TaxID=2755051 RepID=A0A839K2E7_9FIRM|nr:LytTR family DNA-binding domain-containing protein [Variimorphobacter saccharofermentans]MBB2182861.1 response regulator transcription factor [Variimorphobacter saccharofermentans]
MLKIAICDDEKYYRDYIKRLLTEYMNRNQIESCIDLYENGMQLFEQGIKLAKYNIIFLDINMEELDGIKTAYKIRKFNPEAFIVFVTAFINYVLEGYKVDAIRYIMKDSIPISLVECMNTIVKKMKILMKKMSFSFIEGEKQIFIDKIIYVESQKHKIMFKVLEGRINTYSLYDKLDNMEERLKEYGFLRIHKSYLVNMKYIEKISNYRAYLSSDEILPIPKQKFQLVKEAFVLYKGE